MIDLGGGCLIQDISQLCPGEMGNLWVPSHKPPAGVCLENALSFLENFFFSRADSPMPARHGTEKLSFGYEVPCDLKAS